MRKEAWCTKVAILQTVSCINEFHNLLAKILNELEEDEGTKAFLKYISSNIMEVITIKEHLVLDRAVE